MNEKSFDAIVFAGGRGTRLGGVDKAELIVQHERLVDRAITAARTVGARRVIVAGPAHAGKLADVVVREDPPFAGPLAALAAALSSVSSPQVMLLACDLVHPSTVAAQLATAYSDALVAPDAPDAGTSVGVVLSDETGHRQWLASCMRTDALREGIAEVVAREGTLKDGSVASAFRGLELLTIQALPGSTEDIDTPEHLARAQQLD